MAPGLSTGTIIAVSPTASPIPPVVGGDHWTAARQHLLHQRDTERLHELWPRLAWQYECCASRHQMRLLVVVDIVKEPDPICC